MNATAGLHQDSSAPAVAGRDAAGRPCAQAGSIRCLAERIAGAEDWLVGRILEHARRRNYTQYTSTLLEAWRMSIRGLSESLIAGARRYADVPELDPDEDVADDPMTRFGVIEARRHRQRGVSLAMFLGLMKYYKQSYLDLIDERCAAGRAAERCRRFIERCFDRIEIAFCSEWSRTSQEERIAELQALNRSMTNEKNAYQTVFESLSDPALVLSAEGRIIHLNRAAAELLGREHAADTRYSTPVDRLPPSAPDASSAPADEAGADDPARPVGRHVVEVFPWLAEAWGEEGDGSATGRTWELQTLLGGRRRRFLVKRAPLLDVSGKLVGNVLTLSDVTATRQAQEEHDRLFNLTLDLLCVFDTDGVLRQVNPAWSSVIGWSQSEMLSRRWTDFVHPEDLEISLQALATLGEGRPLSGFENRFVGRDGSIRWLSWNAFPLPEERTVFAVARDVTAGRAAERRLHEEHAFRSAVIAGVTEGLCVFHPVAGFPHLEFTVWNDRMTEITGYTMERVNREGWLETLIPDATAREPVLRRLERLWKGDHLRNEEWTIIRADGRKRLVSISTSSITSADGTVHTLALVQDVTEFRQTVQALRSSEQDVRLLLESMAEGVFGTDRHGVCTFCNPAALRMLGFRHADEVLGRNAHELFHHSLPDGTPHDRKQCRVLRTIREGCREHVEGDVFWRADGRPLQVEFWSHPIFRDGQTVGAVITFQDITERQQSREALRRHAQALEAANAALARANTELARQNASLDEFTYVASHDLQEPLRKIVGFSDLLAEDLGDGLSERSRTDLHYITDAARRMQQLIQDLLVLSRTGRAEMKREPTALDDCADRALDILADRAEQRGARISRDPLPVVPGDPVLLTQLYQNLISNALKFVPPERPPEIRLTAERTPEGWILGVRDNGIGIDPQFHEQIFAPFKRLHGQDEYEGTGVGLAICRKVVERHGGRIWVESAPGDGAHFRFSLPLQGEASPASGERE